MWHLLWGGRTTLCMGQFFTSVYQSQLPPSVTLTFALSLYTIILNKLWFYNFDNEVSFKNSLKIEKMHVARLGARIKRIHRENVIFQFRCAVLLVIQTRGALARYAAFAKQNKKVTAHSSIILSSFLFVKWFYLFYTYIYDKNRDIRQWNSEKLTKNYTPQKCFISDRKCIDIVPVLLACDR